ncbi:MAG TPA: bifunctional DNA-formamidopyrimidine glycosylase/DNA-(apurinic or apyrimidinic site) lyase [Vicinamibacterales bacterium]|nr:bifunctional DNA-formamidopyrimidine glycosylase/DNA-(apurinic or apyrimidinic site) lyase [Vicinamibacterales bacterium]
MPELPEVEATRRRLRRAMEGVRIVRIIVRRADLRGPFQSDFAQRLEGQTIRALRRRAKYLVAELSSGDLLLMHLGMSGSFRVERSGRAVLEAHDHVVFELACGSSVIFNDPRRFGSMRVIAGAEAASHPVLNALGPEPLARDFDGGLLASQLRRRRTSLKAALSDQSVVAGLGNIYVSEALHRAGLSPMRRASTLATRSGAPRRAAQLLAAAIKQVLEDAIAGQRRDSEDRFRVYDREGERCRRRRCPGIIRRRVQSGRSTFYCPLCQA